MDSMLEVHKVGTEVVLEKDIKAKIVTVSIHAGNLVQYECAWWNSGARIRDWFMSDDFSIAKKTSPTKIGFSREGEE